jgi:hypothetical protein
MSGGINKILKIYSQFVYLQEEHKKQPHKKKLYFYILHTKKYKYERTNYFKKPE